MASLVSKRRYKYPGTRQVLLWFPVQLQNLSKYYGQRGSRLLRGSPSASSWGDASSRRGPRGCRRGPWGVRDEDAGGGGGGAEKRPRRARPLRRDARVWGCCTVCLGPVPPSAPRCRGPCRLAVLCRRCASDPKAAGLHEEQCLATAALFPGGQTGRPFAVLGGTEELRTALQLLELRRRWLDGQPPRLLQGWADGGDVVQDGWEDVEGLDDHEGGEDPQRELGRLVEMAKAVRLLAPTASRASLEQLVALLLRISCNGMGCHTREEMEIRSRRCRFKGRGRGVFPSAALLNHSCNPNCTFFLDDLGCITIQATRAVARGEELRIAYLSVATRQDTAPSRRAALASSYCFDCFCERCSRELAAERPQGARGTQGSRSAT